MGFKKVNIVFYCFTEFIGFYWVLLGFIGFYMDLSVYHRVLLDFT